MQQDGALSLRQAVLSILRASGYQSHHAALQHHAQLPLVALLGAAVVAQQPRIRPALAEVIHAAGDWHVFAHPRAAGTALYVETIIGPLTITCAGITPHTTIEQVHDVLSWHLNADAVGCPELEYRITQMCRAVRPAVRAGSTDARAVVPPVLSPVVPAPPRVPWWQRLVQRVWRGGAV